MPTYEYVCAKCGHQFEKVQSMKDDSLTVCPKELCARKKWGRGKVKRAVGSGAGLIFKGSGFYLTDYRSEGYKAAAKKDSLAAPGSSGETKSSGDAKPAGDAKKAAPATPAKTESKPAAPAPKSK
ncbi:MAG: zinc ribbon domain-containing protein [Verrucomicrobia bacterium]|nr:zinc ribbon domain-containing protein [Verrucomicrobiota bacterium]